MPKYNVNGQELNVIEAGHPNRQVALLIHGWSSSWYAMSPVMGLLSQRFRCMAVDLPGYGRSPKLPQRTTIDAYVDVLADLIEQVSDGPVVLVGHSMGGMTSLTLAEKYPMLVERMVLLSPTISGKLSTYINLVVSPVTFLERFRIARFISARIQNLIVGVVDRIMRPASFAQRTGITEDDYARLREDARRPDQGEVRAECFRAMLENDLSGRLNKIQTPALVIWGAEDNTVPLRDAGVVADELPEADLRIIPKAGHWPHFERPDATGKMIAAFLGLPLSTNELYEPANDNELLQIQEAANFLAHSDIGTNLNLTQRTRLAAQCHRHVYEPGETIVHIRDKGSDMYIIQDGTVEVWSDPDNPGEWSPDFQKVAVLRPGQVTGELSLFDEGVRTADLVAGESGASVLVLDRQSVFDMCESDPTLGTRFLWNMARAMAHRVRFIQWQFRRAGKRYEEVIRTANLDRQELQRRLQAHKEQTEQSGRAQVR